MNQKKDQTKTTLSAEAGHVNILYLQILVHYYMVNIGPQMPSLFASLSAYKYTNQKHFTVLLTAYFFLASSGEIDIFSNHGNYTGENKVY